MLKKIVDLIFREAPISTLDVHRLFNDTFYERLHQITGDKSRILCPQMYLLLLEI